MGSWLDFGMSSGIDLLKAGVGYWQAKEQASQDRKWIAYKNKLLFLQNGENQKSINVSQEQTREASILSGMQIQKAQYTTEASAEVSAAAAGVTGRSVAQVLNGIDTNAAEAQSNRLLQLQWQNTQFQNQRDASNLQTDVALDNKGVQNPNLGDYLSKGLGDIGKLWNDNQKALTYEWNAKFN